MYPGRRGRDVWQVEGDNYPGTGPDPQRVLDGHDGCYPEAGGLVLPDDVIAARQHPADGVDQAQVGQHDVRGRVDQADRRSPLLSHPHTPPSLNNGQDTLGLVVARHDIGLGGF